MMNWPKWDVIEFNMTPSKYCKQAGLPSLAYAARKANVNRRTFERWFTTKPDLFRLVVVGCVSERKGEKND